MTKWEWLRKSLFMCTVVGGLGMAFPEFRKDLFYIKDNAGIFDWLPSAAISENTAALVFVCVAFLGCLSLLMWHTKRD